MSTNIYILGCLCLIFGSCLSITIHSKPTNQTFPAQFPHAASENSFLSVNGEKRIEVIVCPEGFTFDIKELTCKIISGRAQFTSGVTQSPVVCPGNFRGTLPNTGNCRTFLDCWDGSGFEVPCAEHLLYNNITTWCDWPEEANCCEFWERDSTKLVADM